MTNFVVGVFVARELGVAAFGIFSLAWVTYGVVLNVSRGLATDPLVVRFSGVSELPGGRRPHARRVPRSPSAPPSALVSGGRPRLGGTLGPAFVGLAVVAPGLLLQDSWRFAFFAAARAQGVRERRRVGRRDDPVPWCSPPAWAPCGVSCSPGARRRVAAVFGCLQSGSCRATGARAWSPAA